LPTALLSVLLVESLSSPSKGVEATFSPERAPL
jgi:hypothetical protein